MADTTLTVANSQIYLAVNSLFPTPQQIQGYAADDVMATDPQDSVEAMMGVDGRFSAGWKFKEVMWNITLMANSPSISFFEQWRNTEKVLKEALIATGLILLPAQKKKYTLVSGYLKGYPPMIDFGAIAKPLKFGIVWGSVDPSPL